MQVIANRSITVDGVTLEKGYNELDQSQISALKRSKWKDKDLYVFVDVEQAITDHDIYADEKEEESLAEFSAEQLEKLSFNELRVIAKLRGINSKGMKKVELLEALS